MKTRRTLVLTLHLGSHPLSLPNSLLMVVPNRALLFAITALGVPSIRTLGLSREPLRQSLLGR